MTPTAVLLLALVFGSDLSRCRGSSGDRSPEYRLCVEQCVRVNCSGSTTAALPVSLSLLGWSCDEDCGYHCMHEVTMEDVLHNRPVRQFHGKWPFIRVFGVQEPASMVFSLLNGVAVAVGYHHFLTHSSRDYHLHGPLRVQLGASLNVWIWSTVFHTRDLGWTEKLDYFSAGLMIVCGLVVQFIRLSGEGNIVWQWLYGCGWVVLYLLHVAYLSLGRFNYGYNMAACVSAGILYAAVWTVWSIKEWSRRRYTWKCLAAVVCGSCTVLLELLDFPPVLWAVDAHALWHLSTVPIPLLWYSFLVDDADYETTLRKKIV